MKRSLVQERCRPSLHAAPPSKVSLSIVAGKMAMLWVKRAEQRACRETMNQKGNRLRHCPRFAPEPQGQGSLSRPDFLVIAIVCWHANAIFSNKRRVESYPLPVNDLYKLAIERRYSIITCRPQHKLHS